MQDTAIRTTGRTWDFLEAVIRPNEAKTIHGKLLTPALASGLFITYPKGQVVCQKDDATNVWAKIGTAGYTGPKRVIKYPVIINELGQWQYGPTFHTIGGDVMEDSIAMYYKGFFKTQDLVGLTDDDVMATVGKIIAGNRLAGIIELGAATPVAPA